MAPAILGCFLGGTTDIHQLYVFPENISFVCVACMKPNVKMLSLQTFFFWVKIVSVPKGKIIAALTVCICFPPPLGVLSYCVQMGGLVEETRNLFRDKYHISQNISQQHILSHIKIRKRSFSIEWGSVCPSQVCAGTFPSLSPSLSLLSSLSPYLPPSFLPMARFHCLLMMSHKIKYASRV